jgi:exopolyphosphatase / guanosine-5'-triphosphate,3'-diphosphate pyrophosphatase
MGATPLADADRVQARDRMEWIRSFARRCRSDERHCEQVAHLALGLFDQLPGRKNLPEDARELLQAAALLHEVGYLISHSRHHKHAYHIITHADLPGWSGPEIELVANVARYHRRAFPKKKHPNFGRLNPPERRLVRELSALLRLADGLDRTHTQAVMGVEANDDGDAVHVTVRSERLPSAELWDAKRKSELFEKVYGHGVEITWKRARPSSVKVS